MVTFSDCPSCRATPDKLLRPAILAALAENRQTGPVNETLR
ncbi:MAG: hypothetical protein ABSF26_05275 [Thermoguttaceae bacterium]|jgi:hypothetical protein